MSKPKLGVIVLYRAGGIQRAAIVTKVNENETVNLHVFGNDHLDVNSIGTVTQVKEGEEDMQYVLDETTLPFRLLALKVRRQKKRASNEKRGFTLRGIGSRRLVRGYLATDSHALMAPRSERLNCPVPLLSPTHSPASLGQHLATSLAGVGFYGDNHRTTVPAARLYVACRTVYFLDSPRLRGY